MKRSATWRSEPRLISNYSSIALSTRAAKAVILTAATISSAAFCNVSEALAENFSSGWPVTNPDAEIIPESHCYFTAPNYLGTLNYWANYCLLKKLTSPVSVTIRRTSTPDGSVDLGIGFAEGVDAKTKYYVSQSLWEAAVVRNRAGDCTGKCSVHDSYSAQFAPLRSGQVFIRVIPRSIAEEFRHENFVADRELTAVKNLRTLNLNSVNTSELREFRREWIKFTSRHEEIHSRKEILAFADKLVDKYKWLREK